ncbi:MAG: hypothetical protein ACLSHP_13945 [Coprococcus sp.]
MTDDATKDAIINSMNNRNICSWEAENVDEDSDITGIQAGCSIIIKMSDDTCYGISYRSENSTGDMDGFVRRYGIAGVKLEWNQNNRMGLK